MASDHERVMEMLADYRLAKSWARVDPKRLRVASVEAMGPTQIVLRSTYETRSLRYQLSAASRPVYSPVEPDPWATELVFPAEASAGAKKEEPLLHTQIHFDCGVCSSQGRVDCSDCRGTGRGPGNFPCFTCHGKETVRCKTCDGRGGLLGMPTVQARLDAHEEIRTLGTEAFPVQLVLSLAEHEAAGELIHREQAPHITEVRLASGGYRGEQQVSSKVVETTHAMLVKPGIPGDARIRSQTLEIRRTPVFQVRLESGAMFYVWDKPARVHPIAPLRSWLGRLLFAR